jgi:hypothetical protein
MNYQFGVLSFFVFFLIWLATTNNKWLVKDLPLDIVMLGVWFLTFLPYILIGNFQYGAVDGSYVMVTFTLFIVGILINHYYMYYDKDPKVLGRIALLSIIFYVIGSLQTHLGLIKYPLAARELATGSAQLQSTYYSLGIGGFGFVYGAVFINIVVLYFFFTKMNTVKKSYRYLSIAVYFIISLMLISASYATSLMVLFLGTMTVATIKGKRSLIFGTILLTLFIIAFPKELIGKGLIYAAGLFESNGVIRSKFLDLAQGFIGDSFGFQTVGRGQLYLASLKTFLNNPLFGLYGPFGNKFNSVVGGHSGWLDLLACYGLFGSLPLFAAIFFHFRKHLKYYRDHLYLKFLLTAQILFIAFGFINPVIYIYQIGFVLFVIAPSLPFLPYAFSKKLPMKGGTI